MSSLPFYGLLNLCLFLGCRVVMAADPPPAPPPPLPPSNPALYPPGSPFSGTTGLNNLGTSGSTPSMLALPADTGGSTSSSGSAPAIDAANYRKFYTITAELRETYDNNVNTTNVNQQVALETSISPSILVDFPKEDTEFSARYTFGATYYTYIKNGPTGAQSGDLAQNLDYANTFLAQLRHDFSERFSLSASDQFLQSTDPNLFGSTGTLYRNGENESNSFNAALSSQWTPLFGTQTSYANTLVHYDDSIIGDQQDSLENTATQVFSFSVLPKISVNFGGIVDDITYDQATRGYTSTSIFVGGNWQVLPSLSVSARSGASYTQTKEVINGGGEDDSISPYAEASLNWQLGERSSLSFDYSHEVTPTDQTGANGQQSDRISASFNYAITTYLSSHFQGIYTYNEITNDLISSSALSAYNESDYALDAGVAYHFNKYFDVDFDINISGVSSQLAYRDYSRDQFSIGIRGTY